MKIKPRQLYFFLACVAPVGKLVLLPSQLVYYAKNDLLLPALADFLLQAAAIFCVLLAARRGESFHDLLKGTFGAAAAKAVCCVFALFLFYAALLPLLEQKLFVQSVFYDTLPSLAAFAPFFLFSAFACSKPLFHAGRVWDIAAPVAIAGFSGIVLLSAGTADYGALLPVFGAGAEAFRDGLAHSLPWFFDSALLLPLLGKIEYRKGTAWKGALAYLLGGAAVLLFLAIFYGVYAETAVNHLFAFTKVSQYFAGISVLGRIDYLFVYALALVMCFYVSMPVHAGVELLLDSFGRKKHLPAILSLAANAVLFVLFLVLDYRFGDVLHAVTRTLFPVFPVFCLVLPPLAALLKGVPDGRA